MGRKRNKKKEHVDSAPANVPVSDNVINEGIVNGMVYDKDNWFDCLIAWDVDVTSQLALCRSPTAPFGQFRPIMKLLELSGHGVPWFTWVVVMILSCQDVILLELMTNLFMALVVDIIFITVLKGLIQRERPTHNEHDMFASVSVDKYSFPSGHTTRAVALGCFFVSRFDPGTIWCFVTVTWVTAISLSRILLGRHHVLDVLSGIVVGMLQYPVVMYCWLSKEKCAQLLSTIHPWLLDEQ